MRRNFIVALYPGLSHKAAVWEGPGYEAKLHSRWICQSRSVATERHLFVHTRGIQLIAVQA